MSGFFLQWILGLVLAFGAGIALAEVTLSTSVVRVSALEGAQREPGTIGSVEHVSEVLPGDVLRYTIIFENTSTQDVAGDSVVITNPLPEGTQYLQGSAAGRNTRITYSVDGELFDNPEALLVGEGPGARVASAADYRSIRWRYEPLLGAGESSEVSFELLIP